VTTNINIEVEDSLLLEVLKARQANARGELLNASDLKRLEPIARESLRLKLAARGLDEDGSPLSGSPLDGSSPQTSNSFGEKNSKKQSTESRIGGQEPAASRWRQDIFANFSARNIFPDEGAFMEVTSGDGLSIVTIPWPTVADFPDLLLPYPEGELRGENDVLGNPLPLVYDSLGRLIGSVCGAFSCNARVYHPSYAEFLDSSLSGIFNSYSMQAVYTDDSNSSIHALPIGRDAALVVFRVQALKRAITRVRRSERTKNFVDRDFSEGGPYNCSYDKSPASFIKATFYIEGVEEFHAFRVSANQARYLGLAPQAYVGRFRALPEYKAGTVDDLTITTSRFGTWENLFVGDGPCDEGDDVVLQDIPWSASYSSPDYDRILELEGLAAYKLLGGGAVTPAVYSVFANSGFRETPGQAITDTYVKSFVPAFSGSLKWRTADNEQTPYSFLGPPPESWGVGGPTSILSGFPGGWKKSGNKNSLISPTFTHTAWDWNNPAYCRQQALALGFAEADLTP
jgi:hypothetical protein